MADAAERIFTAMAERQNDRAPLYLRFRKAIETSLNEGVLKSGDALPSERDLAAKGEISRVTVRKALQSLVDEGVLVQRHGSGTFVAPGMERAERSQSRLTSFTEDMARRGKVVRSVWLERGRFVPSPQEMMALGLAADDMVMRINRLRYANEISVAIEYSSLVPSMLSDPEEVGDSLYAALAKHGNRPVRAVQRIWAASLEPEQARLLRVPAGFASLNIERVSYLASGKIVEFTRSIFRGDTYEFVAELRLPES
jgi:GntR family transcriptional regulator